VRWKNPLERDHICFSKTVVECVFFYVLGRKSRACINQRYILIVHFKGNSSLFVNSNPYQLLGHCDFYKFCALLERNSQDSP
jgi:hypothetical protein